MQLLKVPQSDWCCQRSGEVHKNLSKVTRHSFSPCAHYEGLACTTKPDSRTQDY